MQKPITRWSLLVSKEQFYCGSCTSAVKRVPAPPPQGVDPAETAAKARPRGEPDFYAGEQHSVRHTRLMEEFELDSHPDAVAKRRRTYDENSFEARRSDWEGPTSRLSNDWDRDGTTFDFLADQAPPAADKPTMIRAKKTEIEKAFRQDCETLTSAVKLLVSKDPDLETRLQFSLRENLKDIGQRCIQELREFMERVNSNK